MLLIITSTGERLFRFINIDDLERSWSSQKRVFSEILAIFGCSTHVQHWIVMKWMEVDQDNSILNFQH